MIGERSIFAAMQPLLLTMETATRLCSVAVGRGDRVLALRETDTERPAHAERLHVFIAEVMEEAGFALKDLDAVAVGIGPGSYTGLRIGLSTAKGLCYALDRPIIGLSTLGTLVSAARGAHGSLPGTLWPMVDARRMEVFARPCDAQGQPLADASPLILDESWAAGNGMRVVFGDGADKAAHLWAANASIIHLPGIRPSAAAMLPDALARSNARQVDDLAYLVPDYGKAAHVGNPRDPSTA